MASFQEHIDQANKNLDFLEKVNVLINDRWDWQVTTCYYVAVHLVNAHLAKKVDQHYRKHEDVRNAINPTNVFSLAKMPELNYISYIKLEGLARRSRYLCKETRDHKDDGSMALFTYDRHLSKALINLDIVLSFIEMEHNIIIPKIQINCIELKGKNLNHFVYTP